MKKQNRIGETFINNVGEKFQIIGYDGWYHCTIQFEDGTVSNNVCYANIKRGEVKNYNTPSTMGVGYVGYGQFKTYENGEKTEAYLKFTYLISRCYRTNFQEFHYIVCSVCKEWHNFQNFAEWFYENYNPETMQGWHLDKDILVKGNKIYSPETCCFVPQEINNLFPNKPSKRGDYPVGVKKAKNRFTAVVSINGKNKFIGSFKTPEEAFAAYKVAKEKHIRNKAEEWRDLISEQVYQAMYNYKVEITD